jgi:hypothetical protein
MEDTAVHLYGRYCSPSVTNIHFKLHPHLLRSCRSQWPRGLRLRSAAAGLLKLWLRIPPRAWLSVVGVVCCRVEVSATR